MVKLSKGDDHPSKGAFEPKIIKKYETTWIHIEEQIIAMYAKGRFVRDIRDHMRDIY